MGDVKVDVAKMLKRKDDIVGKMTKGIEFLFRKNKVTLLKGYGKFVGKTAEGFSRDRRRSRHRQAGHHRHRLEGTSPARHRRRQQPDQR